MQTSPPVQDRFCAAPVERLWPAQSTLQRTPLDRSVRSLSVRCLSVRCLVRVRAKAPSESGSDSACVAVSSSPGIRSTAVMNRRDRSKALCFRLRQQIDLQSATDSLHDPLSVHAGIYNKNQSKCSEQALMRWRRSKTDSMVEGT